MSLIRRLLLSALAIVAIGAFPSPARSAAPVDDPRINARAREWLDRSQSGNVDRTQFTAEMNTALSDATVVAAKATLGPLGPPSAFILRAHYDLEGNSVWVYRATFKDESWNEQIAFSADGKISELYFRPAPPPSDAAIPGEDAAMTARVRAEFLAWQQGSIDRSRYTTDAAAAFTDALVAREAAELGAFGPPTAFTFRGKTQPAGGTIYAYRVTCPNSDVWVIIGIDAGGKINGIAFQPE